MFRLLHFRFRFYVWDLRLKSSVKILMGMINQQVYAEKYEFLADIYAKAKDKLDKTEIANRNSRKNMIAVFLDELKKQERLITDFDTGLWNAVIETMTIYSKEHIVFKFRGGTEIKWSIV